MAHLVAEGSEPGHQWCRELPAGQPVCLGRAPEQGWDVSWDRQISRNHVDLLFADELLTVKLLASARNPLHFDGETTDACVLGFDESFRIGHTTFRLAATPPGSATGPATPSPHPRRIGPYAITRLLGSGGMGSVYLASHGDTGQTVALKVLGQQHMADPQLLKRFHLEAKAAQQLAHPNIVAVYEAATVDGMAYIAQEFVDGIDIERLLQQRQRLAPRRSLDIIRQVAGALQHAHQQGIVHRDIKPSNLLVTSDGTTKLADMGLARSVDAGDSRVTMAGSVVGTIDYIAPEQADDSRSADARSDIYSLGCTWYEMLTGSPPFPNGNLTEKINAHATQPPPDPRDINPDVSEAIVAVLDRMMAKSPDQRHQSAEELLEDIENDMLLKTEVSEDILAGLADSSDELQLDDIPEPSQPATGSRQVLVATCDACGRSYRIRGELAGRKLKCRECGEVINARAQ